MVKRTYALIISAVLLSCGERDPTFDASTDDSIKLSYARVQESLPNDRRAEFSDAFRDLALADINVATLGREHKYAGRAALEERIRSNILHNIHGKTGEQIIADATKLRARVRR